MTLGTTPGGDIVQQKTDRLMLVVLEAVYILTLRAKPSLYIKQ